MYIHNIVSYEVIVTDYHTCLSVTIESFSVHYSRLV